jgi:hypothetical protein
MEGDAVTTPSAPGKTSRWEDYIDVFFSPAELFRRRAGDRVGPPLTTLLVLGVLAYIAALPVAGMMMRAATAANPEAAEFMAGGMGTVFALIGGLVVPITYLLVIVSAAALLWLAGRLVDVRADFSRTMLIATYAAFVYLLSQVAGSGAVMLHGEVGLDVVRHTSFGPLRFIEHAAMNPVLVALLRRLDAFAIWQAVLWGVGIAVIYRTTRAQAAVTAAGTWILLAVPGIVWAALGFGVNTAG